jgi:hypothetical protein
MIEDMKQQDYGMIAGAAVMALGAFCPIVSVPILGSLNYVMGGNGDGIFIVGGSMIIVLLVLVGYRRAAALVATGSLLLMTTTLVKFANGMSSMQAEAARTAKSNPIGGGIATILSKSVGLEWGWILLFGGAFAVIIFAVLVGASVSSARAQIDPSKSETVCGFSSADRLIADYLEQAKQPKKAAHAVPAGFGKRMGH